MAGRGRRPGYVNYTPQDQVLLCTIIEELIPIGRNQWEQVTIQFNVNRSRGSPERDLDSLRRKFKTLYMSKKPTGSGEVPIRLRPIMMAKAAQAMIEAQGGVHTSHDGLDRGEDDGEFLPAGEVLSRSTMGDSNNPDTPSASQGEERKEDNQDAEATASLQAYRDAAELDEAEEAQAEEEDGVSNRAEPDEPPSRTVQVPGIILTRGGGIDANLAHLYEMMDDGDSTAEDEAAQKTSTDLQITTAQDPGNDSTTRRATTTTPTHTRAPGSSMAASRRSTLGPRRSAHSDPVTTNQPPVSTPIASRVVGRPRGSRREPLPTVASPDGPQLHRDPSRAAQDARESENRNWNIASNRLGGSDLRVFRDNVSAMTTGGVNANGKRTQGDPNKPDGTPGNLSFAKNRRVKAKARLDEIQKEIEAAERKQSSSGSDIMGMLSLLQKEGDRRAEEEERRRREDREERREAEKRDREERERVRSEEAKAALEMRLEAAREARMAQEAITQANASRDAQRDIDREDNKRRFEERLALDREEARQRHEQMMLLLANLKK